MDRFDKRAGQPLDDGSMPLDIAASRSEGARRRKDLELDRAGEKHAARSLHRERGQASQRPDVKFAGDHRRGDLRVAAKLQDRDVFIGLQAGHRQRIAREGIGFRAVLRDATIATFKSSTRRAFELRPTMSFWLDRLAAAPRIAISAPLTRARVNAVTPAKTTSKSPAMRDWTNRGLPVMRRISAARSCLASIPTSLATHGSESERLGLT